MENTRILHFLFLFLLLFLQSSWSICLTNLYWIYHFVVLFMGYVAKLGWIMIISVTCAIASIMIAYINFIFVHINVLYWIWISLMYSFGLLIQDSIIIIICIFRVNIFRYFLNTYLIAIIVIVQCISWLWLYFRI
jgi:hypothetical protein